MTRRVATVDRECPNALASGLYVGTVRHRRFRPRPHSFRYPLYMTYLDLGELDRVFAGRWLWSTDRPSLSWFRRADYLGDPHLPLDESVRRLVEVTTSTRPEGPIRLLTHLRTFGLSVNPVSFYYCFDGDGTRLETIVAEIINTPWNERFCYVLTDTDRDVEAPVGPLRAYRLDKRFHVSPFMPMDLHYRWHFGTPDTRAFVHMVNLDPENRRLFDATLDLQRQPLDGPSMARVLAGEPLITARVLARIYWQAARLWWKRTPFHTHPDKQPAAVTQGVDR